MRERNKIDNDPYPKWQKVLFAKMGVDAKTKIPVLIHHYTTTAASAKQDSLEPIVKSTTILKYHRKFLPYLLLLRLLQVLQNLIDGGFGHWWRLF
jgi:hypothetical protein